LGELGVDAGHELSADGPPAPDHGVGVMASRHPGGTEIDLPAEARLIGVEDERTDVTADVEDQGLGGTVPRSVVAERYLPGHRGP
jgi:hypothetical protein